MACASSSVPGCSQNEGKGHAWIKDRDTCIECGACRRDCPEEAIAVQAGTGCDAVINAMIG